MSTSPFADDVYQPQSDGGQSGELLPDQGDPFDGPTEDQILDSGYSPPEQPLALRYLSQREPGSGYGAELTDRLGRELADQELERAGLEDECADEDGTPIPGCGGPRAGRIVMGDDDLQGYDVGIDGGAASAEEAAMHLIHEDDEAFS